MTTRPVTTPEIFVAEPRDAALLNAALAALSRDLGDRHRATDALLARACAPDGCALGLLAGARDAVRGALLATPILSTTLGTCGLQVSDLWVAPEMRGAGLGRALLREAARLGQRRWGANFLRLSVYADNDGARAMYRHCGFVERAHERVAILSGDPWRRLLDPGPPGG